MIPRTDDLIRVLPEAIWCGFGVLLMLLQPFTSNRQLPTFFAILRTGLGTAPTLFPSNPRAPPLSHLIQMHALRALLHLLNPLLPLPRLLAPAPHLQRLPL